MSKEFEICHFTGIGGAGMAPLAAIMLEKGSRVSGSDPEQNKRCEALAGAGATIYTEHKKENVPDNAFVVYSSAISPDNPELATARERGLTCCRRGEFLARFADTCRRTVAVSGSHGKTSITAMLAWCLSRNFPDTGWLIGGEVAGFPSSRAGNGDIFITEVDESDGTHTFVHPAVGIVPNVDDDHDWSVGGTEQLMANFRTFGNNCGKIIALAGSNVQKIFAGKAQIVDPADSCYDILPDNLIGFQRWNGALVLECARHFGIPDSDVLAALAEFPGVERRLSCRGSAGNAKVIEDYAHHPAEVAASIAALRKMTGPDGKLTVIFQPHRYARLEKYFDRLAAELSGADRVFIVPVFAAWCETGNVGSAQLAAACNGKAEFIDSEDWKYVAEYVISSQTFTENDILAVIGAGTIGKLPAELISCRQNL